MTGSVVKRYSNYNVRNGLAGNILQTSKESLLGTLAKFIMIMSIPF